MNKEFILGWGCIFLSALFDCFTIFVVKWRANFVGKFEFVSLEYAINYALTFIQHPLVWLCALSFFLGPLFGYIGLTRIDLTTAYPVSITLHIIFTFLFGIFLLHEPMHLYKMIGVSLMFTGLYFFFKS
ncbi:MAG TPA: EamA family transporter [Chitinophagales bacterium]|nr:EamA family transporter [Chitinophagales bacterium]